MSEITESEIQHLTKEQNYIRGYADGRADERARVIEKINIAEDKLVACYKNTKDIMTIRMAFAEMRESLNS